MLKWLSKVVTILSFHLTCHGVLKEEDASAQGGAEEFHEERWHPNDGGVSRTVPSRVDNDQEGAGADRLSLAAYWAMLLGPAADCRLSVAGSCCFKFHTRNHQRFLARKKNTNQVSF